MMVYFLTGTFRTVAQEDVNGDSTPVVLHIARAWQEEAGPAEAWLYFEYSLPADTAHPFRQKLYRLRAEGRDVYADAFPLQEPARWVGEWSKAKPFESLDRSRLREEPRCRMRFIRNMETLFTGGTIGEQCPAETEGAATHRSDLYIGSISIRSWDRDFDAAGKQVTGPPGPWEFRKTAL